MALRGFRIFIAIVGFLASAGVALAQSPECNRFRAELAALDRSGNFETSPAAERLRQELARMQNYYRSIGCERRGFLFSNATPPEECPAIAQRLRSMQASYDRQANQGPSGNIEARRQQLVSAINQSCSDNRNFFERLFGVPPQQQQNPDGPITETPSEPRLGGKRTVCVRMCDGYFFPLSTTGKASADEMCQALCPATQTRAFSMPGGDDALPRAVSQSGPPYTSLPGAFRFSKSVDPSCYCKTEEQKWSEVLKSAEELLGKNDTIVSAQRAEELSRPKQATPPKGKQAVDAIARKIEQAETAESQAAAKEGEAAPTAGSESAGIGPQSIEGGRIVGRNEGVKREGVASDGNKRTVRIITPSSAPALLTEPESR